MRQKAGVVEKEPEIVVKKGGKEVPMKDPVVKSVPVMKSKEVAKKPVKGDEPMVEKKVKKVKVAEVVEEKPKKGGFAGFMSAHKGKGHSMKELAEMYREQKKSS
jgi:hypothetical protein